MHVYGEIQGTLSSMGGVTGTLSAPQGIQGTLSVSGGAMPPSYEGPYEATPTEAEQTLETKELYMTDDVIINPIPDPYIIPTGTLEISQNGETDVTEYAAVDVDIQPALQNKTVTVSSAGDTDITADSDYYGLSKATATVPTGEASQGTLFGYRDSGTRWRVRGYNDVNTAGWFDAGRSQGSDTSFYAIPSGTTVTPTESSQTIGGSDYMMQGAVTVNAIPSDYVGSAVPRDDSSDLTANGATVTAPAGYYSADATKTIASGSATTPATSITANPTINVNSSTGVITATASATKSITPTVSAGYVSSGTAGTVTVSGSNTSNLSTQAGTTISPSESQQTAVASGKYTTEAVIVDAIPSDYVGSAIDRRSSSDLSASGATVTAPAGYYSAAATKSVASGTAGTPTASKGAVSNHSVTVTPSVTNTAGYISGGTKTGTGVSVSASELVSGTRSITSNGTGIDVKDYAAVDVNVSGSAPVLQTITKSYTPTESAQSETITASAGYDGIEEVDVTVSAISSTYVGSGVTRRDSTNLSVSGATVTAPSGYYASSASKSVSSGSATPASSISGTSATVSTGTNTLTLSKTVSNTPQVSAGYISSGTAGNSSVSLTASVSTKAATTYHPSTSNQTIASGTYTTGTQTINAVTLSNLTADNIKAGVTVKVGDSSDDDCVASVLGTYSGGGGDSKNVQVLQSTTRTNSSSLTKVLGDLTVSKTGTYDIYWSGGRSNTSSSYTWGTRLYVDSSGYGTENTSWTNNEQSNHLSNVSLNANQKLSVYARGRTGSYYTFVPMLVIIES